MKKVTAYILNRDGARYLASAIESILDSDYPDMQVILSDNGSKDQSTAIAAPFEKRGLRIIRRQPPADNFSVHVNTCLMEATTPYVSLFHCDDLIGKNMVRAQAEFLDAHPEVDIVHTAAQVIDFRDKPLWPIALPEGMKDPILDPNEALKHVMLRGNTFFVCPTAMFRSDSLKRLGPFSEHYRLDGDIEMWLRYLIKGKVAYLNEPLFRYRFWDGQGGQRVTQRRVKPSDLYQICEEYLPQAKLTPDEKMIFEQLKALDRLHVGLSRITLGEGAEDFLAALLWFKDPAHRKFRKHLGAADRLKVHGALRFYFLLQGKRIGPATARMLLDQTDPRTGLLLKGALSLKRQFLTRRTK